MGHILSFDTIPISKFLGFRLDRPNLAKKCHFDPKWPILGYTIDFDPKWEILVREPLFSWGFGSYGYKKSFPHLNLIFWTFSEGLRVCGAKSNKRPFLDISKNGFLPKNPKNHQKGPKFPKIPKQTTFLDLFPPRFYQMGNTPFFIRNFDRG